MAAFLEMHLMTGEMISGVWSSEKNIPC
jgi:hypothetical protein